MATPFDLQTLTPKQQQQIADRAKATAALVDIDADITDTKAQLVHIYDQWMADSQPLPAQSPLDPKIEHRNADAAQYYATQTLLRALITYRGAVLGWKLNAGQPNHPPGMPEFTAPTV